MMGASQVRLTGQAKRLARATSRRAGQLTHSGRMLPDFLIVGAQRCGTTSLYRTLSQHPAVLPAIWHKGVHFFDTGYAHGMAWYQGHFPLMFNARRVRQRTGVTPITGESSPYYMFHPLAPERIARDLPGVRLIVLLRDPVERAYSAHAHELARGFEVEPFERALDLEDQRLTGEVDRLTADPTLDGTSLQHHAYLARGRYIEQLERLETYFGRERIHVIDSHDFFEDPAAAYSQVLEFLRLPPRGKPRFERHNARSRSPMPAALRTRLERHFEPYDERLTSWWRTTPSWRR